MNRSGKVNFKAKRQVESQEIDGQYFEKAPAKPMKSYYYRTGVDNLVMKQHYIIIITDEELKPLCELIPFSIKITRNLYYSAMWKIIKDTKCVVLQRGTCQEMLSLMAVAKNLSPTAEYLWKFFKSRDVPQICPSVVVPPHTKIPANVSSAKGFVKHVLSDNKVRPELVDEYGFGVVVSLWYMTVESSHLPNMMIEFSSLVSIMKNLKTFPSDLQYDGGLFTKTNLLYNRNVATYRFLKGNAEDYEECWQQQSMDNFKTLANVPESVHLEFLFSRAALERLCAVGNANPAYKHAIIRSCFAPLQCDPIVEHTIQSCIAYNGFKSFSEAERFAFGSDTLVHARPEVKAEKERLVKKLMEISCIRGDFRRKFPAAYGVAPLEEYNFYYTLNLARHCSAEHKAIKGNNNNSTGIPAYYFAMAEVKIGEGLTWVQLADFAESHGLDVGTLKEEYFDYVRINKLPGVRSG